MMTPLAYLATPYTAYDEGKDAAFVAAAGLTAKLLLSGVHVYSPIVHFHTVAALGKIEASDEFWLSVDEVMMAHCDTLLVAHMPGWDKSAGIAHEIKFFEAARKPVYDLNIYNLLMVRR